MQILSNPIYLPQMHANSRDFRALKEIGVEEHDCDVRFFDRKWKYGRFAHVQ